MARVTVVGMGYVGVATTLALAWIGHETCGVEVDPSRLSQLEHGQAPFFEPGIEGMLAALRPRLHFTGDLGRACLDADAVFITVGTPSRPDGSADLTSLEQVVADLRKHLRRQDTIVVNKSTAPVGTLDRLATHLPGTPLAANPEFLRQGQAILDTLYPDRIVVGTRDAGAGERLRKIYQPIVDGSLTPPPGMKRPVRAEPPFLLMDPNSAELAKYAANAFLALKISFINEIANVCDGVGADIDRVADVIGRDPRIGRQYLRAGIGYGGSCFPKDTRALHAIAGDSGYPFQLLRAVIEVNQLQAARVAVRLEQALGGSLDGRCLAVLGLTFKPGTDDLRESPSLAIIGDLVARGAHVRVHDPVALDHAHLPEGAEPAAGVRAAVAGADAVLVLTEWPEYVALSEADLAGMRGGLIYDGRNALDPARFPHMVYVGVGRSATALGQAEAAAAREKA
ncbi:MAG TPA: UDP-glucose/GDP-mannose dehydrogenase family protein [Bacillota bacterium]|nr:UDP-glucose/GDP-mannose dehydrogenase family protein [Bacillota bacterium]